VGSVMFGESDSQFCFVFHLLQEGFFRVAGSHFN
jgi:hypothetical protein